MKKEGKLKILGEYVGHLLLGAAMFLALMVVSGGVGYSVHMLESAKGVFSPDHIWAAHSLDITIFYCDCAFLGFWSLYSTDVAVMELIDNDKDKAE